MESTILQARRREREAALEAARNYVSALALRTRVQAAAVVGSFARGDFNVWSDIDVLIVAEGQPARVPDRTAFLFAGVPGGLEPIALTPDEFRRAYRKHNPLVREAVDTGVVIWPPDDPGALAAILHGD